jgi:hypothetical protein
MGMAPAAGFGWRTAAAVAARRRTTVGAVQRVHDALTRLRREESPVSVAAVARPASVSRTDTTVYIEMDGRGPSGQVWGPVTALECLRARTKDLPP